MRIPLCKNWFGARQQAVEPQRRKRRGATAMEYLVMISFVLVVLILAIQHIGSITGRMLGNSAKATNFTGSTAS